MKWREYFLYAKKIITTLFNNSSHLRHTSAILENIHWTQTAYAVLCQPHHTDMLFLLNNDLLNKVFFFFLCIQKVFSSLQSSDWTTDGRWTVLTMSLYCVSVPWPCKDPCSLWRVRELSDFIKNIAICVSKMNEGLLGLERHEGE